MPIYSYCCSECNHEEERIESYSADSVKDCPKCNTKFTLIRKISVSSFQLAGGGWYKDSYGK